MAFELYGLLAGSVSPVTGEHIKPAYGGNEEAFLTDVVTPIYKIIAKVLLLIRFLSPFYHHSLYFYIYDYPAMPIRKLSGAKEGDPNIPNGVTMMI